MRQTARAFLRLNGLISTGIVLVRRRVLEKLFPRQTTTQSARLETVSAKLVYFLHTAHAISSEGCIYTNLKDMSIEDLKAAGNYIMGCQDTANNKVNGRASIGSEDTLVCLSDGNGCGDCL